MHLSHLVICICDTKFGDGCGKGEVYDRGDGDCGSSGYSGDFSLLVRVDVDFNFYWGKG